MPPVIRIKLSAMMFLEFFIWGAWFVTLGTFLLTGLKTTGTQVGVAFLTQSIGAIIAPFIIGLIADRFFFCPVYTCVFTPGRCGAFMGRIFCHGF